MKRTLSALAQAVGGELIGEDRPYGAVATDSRTLSAGSLFVALRGPNFDGSGFIRRGGRARRRGRPDGESIRAQLPQVRVSDALHALQALANRWRRDFTLPIVAVAGATARPRPKR